MILKPPKQLGLGIGEAFVCSKYIFKCLSAASPLSMHYLGVRAKTSKPRFRK